jgi:3-deoxy-7-phosphoheptulonate synthase
LAFWQPTTRKYDFSGLEKGEGKMIIGMEGAKRDGVRDQRIAKVVELAPPETLMEELPLGSGRAKSVVRGREEVVEVLHGRDPRLMVVVGPCSVHDPKAALEYARRLSGTAKELRENLLIVMRVYFEKPRTTTGWKGLINDPHLDNSGDVNAGLRIARKLLLEVVDLDLPVGCEFLDPITPQYISDAVAWGAIGARTAESQTHRQLGSGLSMPIGFKNRTDGNIQVAVDAVRAAAVSHAFAGIDDAGNPAILHTTGNPDCHIILRGGHGMPNYHVPEVEDALVTLGVAGLPERLVIDASHDNSGKDPEKQFFAAGEIADQVADGNKAIVGVMLESFLVEGRQELRQGEKLTYGQSITDACLDWEDTASALDRLAAAVEARRGS